MKKIVINERFGGFSLSIEALLECYKRGMTGLLMPADEYFSSAARRGEAEQTWKNYISSGKTSNWDWVVPFTPDLQHVITWPSNDQKYREDPILVSVVEDLGVKINGSASHLVIVEFPDVPYIIREYDGNESVEVDSEIFGNMMELATTDQTMNDLLERCVVYYTLKVGLK